MGRYAPVKPYGVIWGVFAQLVFDGEERGDMVTSSATSCSTPHLRGAKLRLTLTHSTALR